MNQFKNINLWKETYSNTVNLLTASLNLINTNNDNLSQVDVITLTPLPIHFSQHENLIEQVLSIFMMITNEDGYFFKSNVPNSSLEKLRYAIHRENENAYLAQFGHGIQPRLLSNNQDIDPTLNYEEAYLELLQLNTLIIIESIELNEM